MPDHPIRQPVDCSNESEWRALRTNNFPVIQACLYGRFRQRIRTRFSQEEQGWFDDVFQESLCRVWGSVMMTQRPEQIQIEPYLYRTVKNRMIDIGRKRKDPGAPNSADPDPVLATNEVPPESDWTEILFLLWDEIEANLIQQLTDDEWRILDAVICLGLRYEAITERKIFVNEKGEPLKPEYLRLKTHRALKKLRGLVIMHYLDACEACMADAVCQALLKACYGRRKEPEQKTGEEQDSARILACLLKLKKCVLQLINRKKT